MSMSISGPPWNVSIPNPATNQLGGRRSRALKKLPMGRLVVFGNQQGGGGSNSLVGTNWTTAYQMELEADFIAIRVWVPNADTSAAATQVKVAVAVQDAAGAFGAAANIDYSAGDGLVNATFDNGQTSAAAANGNAIAAASAANLPTWKATDWIGIKSRARTDGGTRPLLHVRVEHVWVSANWALTVPYINGSGWQDGVGAGGRLLRRFAQNVNGVSTPANFTSLAAENSKFCAVMVEYMLANGTLGVQHLIDGDSNDEGAGATDSWYGHAQRAVYELSSPTAPREYANCAEHSQTPDTYTTYAIAMLPNVQPDVIHYSPYSINAISTDCTTGVIRNARSNLGKLQAAAATYRPAYVIRTALPCNAAFKSYTNDARRRALNADLPALQTYQIALRVADVSTLYSAGVDGNDQTQIISGLTSDNVHPNDAGHEALKVAVKAAIQLLP